MDREESILEALEDDESLAGDLSDVDMIDAEPSDTDGGDVSRSEATKNAVVADGVEDKDVKPAGHKCGGGVGSTNYWKNKKKKMKRKNRREKVGGADCSIAGINRFVINTCRHLKEKKQYLVWSAVSCLGLSTVRDLVKEVDAIQACGGQQTADGKRSRTGGGVLWNILKTREPKAYKEIMAKGREFEKQFQPSHIQKAMEKDEFQKVMKDEDKVNLQRGYGFTHGNNQSSAIQRADIEMHRKQSNVQLPSAMDRIPRHVSHDDLFEEGEMHFKEKDEVQEVMKEKDEVQEVMKEKDKVNSQMDNLFTDENSQRSVVHRDDIDMHQWPSNTQRPSALDRIRRPVSYDDLFEEGEIY